MADAYGLNDLSLLTTPQQETARNINDAFKASMAARDRNLARYSMAAPSAPMMAEMENEAALKRAQFTAGILNQNQQIQNLIDASHATPHGIAQNLAAYLPTLGATMNMMPWLFGTKAASDFAKEGAIGTVAKWFKNPMDGNTYALDSSGKIIGTYDQTGTMIPSYGTSLPMNTSQLMSPEQMSSAASNASWDMGWNPTEAVTTAPYDFGSSIVGFPEAAQNVDLGSFGILG